MSLFPLQTTSSKCLQLSVLVCVEELTLLHCVCSTGALSHWSHVDQRQFFLLHKTRFYNESCFFSLTVYPCTFCPCKLLYLSTVDTRYLLEINILLQHSFVVYIDCVLTPADMFLSILFTRCAIVLIICFPIWQSKPHTLFFVSGSLIYLLFMHWLLIQRLWIMCVFKNIFL